MESWWRRLASAAAPPQIASVPGPLLAIILAYSFSSQFLPIEPYLVPYLTTVKHFSDYQLTVDIFPVSVYAQLASTLLLAPACFYLSHKIVIILGSFALLATYLVVWGGQSLLMMQLMQHTAFLLPKDQSLSLLPSLRSAWNQNKGISVLKETWNGRTLQILSLWWAITFAGLSLVQNYGTNLFDAVDSQAKFNGHILAASQAVGSIGSYGAVYMENFAIKHGMLVYVLGSASMGIFCACMGMSVEVWEAYILYVLISGIYQTLLCLVSVRCGRLLSNGQFVLLFSINNFAGLLIETLLQAALEISGLSIFVQYKCFAGLFFLATVIVIGLCCTGDGRSEPTLDLISESEHVHLITESS